MIGSVNIGTARAASKLWQDTTRTTLATTIGDPVCRIEDDFGKIYLSSAPWTLRQTSGVYYLDGNTASGFTLQGGSVSGAFLALVGTAHDYDSEWSWFTSGGIRYIPVQYHFENGGWDVWTMNPVPNYRVNGVATGLIAADVWHQMNANFTGMSGVLTMGGDWSGKVAAWKIGSGQELLTDRQASEAAWATEFSGIL